MTTSEIATLAGYEEFAPWLLVEKRGNVHVVSINRPEAFNAVNEQVHHAFATIWRVLAADDDVRAVVTTGVGKAFSAGGDMVMSRQFFSLERMVTAETAVGPPMLCANATRAPST